MSQAVSQHFYRWRIFWNINNLKSACGDSGSLRCTFWKPLHYSNRGYCN